MGMTIADWIRAMDDEELAQFLVDIAYENLKETQDTYMNIPSPLGGYLVVGITELTDDTDLVVEALQEEVENENKD